MNLKQGNKRRERFVRQLRKEKLRRRPLTHQKSAIEQLRLQNKFRTLITRIAPTGLKQVHEIGTGVDFIYSSIKIDQKFSFGVLGENKILARVNEHANSGEQKLINESNWMMVIRQSGKVDFFETKKMAEFIQRNFGSLQRLNRVESRNPHIECAVDLEQFYKDSITKPKIISVDLELAKLSQNGEPNQYSIEKMKKRLSQALEKVKSENYKMLAPQKPKTRAGVYGNTYKLRYNPSRGQTTPIVPKLTKKQRGLR